MCRNLNTKESKGIIPFHQTPSDKQPLLTTSDIEHSQVYTYFLHFDLCIAILVSVKCRHSDTIRGNILVKEATTVHHW